jgi:hypothetical protein
MDNKIRMAKYAVRGAVPARAGELAQQLLALRGGRFFLPEKWEVFFVCGTSGKPTDSIDFWLLS